MVGIYLLAIDKNNNNKKNNPCTCLCIYIWLYADIAREILEVRPRFAGKTDKNGFSPLHYASSIGNVNMTKLLLNHNKDLALQYNKDGYTPLHLAAINGRVKILVAFLSSSPASFDRLTTYGETVFHLAVRFDKYNVFKFLAESFNTCLFHRQDQFGNTVLHLAVLRKNYQVRLSFNLVIVDWKNYNSMMVHCLFISDSGFYFNLISSS